MYTENVCDYEIYLMVNRDYLSYSPSDFMFSFTLPLCAFIHKYFTMADIL